jgi:hypothetical protein
MQKGTNNQIDRPPSTPKNFLTNQEELRGVLNAIDRNIVADKDKKKHPINKITRLLFLASTNAPTAQISDCIRKIHDFYGWMAKNAGHFFGGCSGCIYRTAGFLDIDPTQRDGSNKTSRNIHVEHLVPVKMLREHLLNSPLQHPEDLLALLLDSSICVAMSHNEERLLSPSGVPKDSSPSLTLDFQDVEKPFRRYAPMLSSSSNTDVHFEVYDMVRGQAVDMQSFTFADHRRNISSLFNN